MTIKVKLTGNTVSVHPMDYPVNNGNHTVQWGPHEHSDTFTFADTPISFDDPAAPIGDLSASGDTASGTDDNTNNGGQDTDYGYHLHLIDANGNPITWPPLENKMMTNDPMIRNRPG